MSIKTFFIKKIMKMKGVPPEQIEMIMKLMDRDPELFKKIGKEIKQKIKEGKEQTLASMEVMRKYQGEITKLMRG